MVKAYFLGQAWMLTTQLAHILKSKPEIYTACPSNVKGKCTIRMI